MIINNHHIKIRRFSSREMKLKWVDFEPLMPNNEATILYNHEESVFELMLICKFLIDNKVKVNLILSYLPYQRMDHKHGFEAYTVKYVAELFNSLGLNSVTICEPHCDVSIFNNATAFSFVDALYQKVKEKIGFDEEKDYVVFTDKGSHEKYDHIGKNHIHFEKTRDKATGLIASHKMIGTILPNRKVLLVDDVISSGDTIASCLELMPENKVNIICGHYEKNKYNMQVLNNKKVQCVYSSNSLSKRQKPKLVLYSTQDLVHLDEIA